jgi:hypothetical protein
LVWDFVFSSDIGQIVASVKPDPPVIVDPPLTRLNADTRLTAGGRAPKPNAVGWDRGDPASARTEAGTAVLVISGDVSSVTPGVAAAPSSGLLAGSVPNTATTAQPRAPHDRLADGRTLLHALAKVQHVLERIAQHKQPHKDRQHACTRQTERQSDRQMPHRCP